MLLDEEISFLNIIINGFRLIDFFSFILYFLLKQFPSTNLEFFYFLE